MDRLLRATTGWPTTCIVKVKGERLLFAPFGRQLMTALGQQQS